MGRQNFTLEGAQCNTIIAMQGILRAWGRSWIELLCVLGRTPQPAGEEREGWHREPPREKGISVCLPGVFLTFRMGDDFLIVCDADNQIHEEKIKI